MDQRRFDALTRLLAHWLDRRQGLGAALMLAFAATLGADIATSKKKGGKGKDRNGGRQNQDERQRKRKERHKENRNRKKRKRQRAHVQGGGAGRRACDDIPLREGADLANCDLRQHPDLPKADFTDAKLEDSILSGASLRNVSFRGARLWRAKLDGADLTNANFNDSGDQRTDVYGVDFSDANLTGASLDFDNVLYARYAIFCRTTMPNGGVDNSRCP